MKKILALMLALVFAAVSFSALCVTGFADEVTTAEATTEEKATDPIPSDPETPTEAEKTTEAEKETETEAEKTTAEEKTTEEVVTLPEGSSNNINDPNENGTTEKVPVDDEIPNTGSGIVVPALALLALAGGATIAVKSKKD